MFIATLDTASYRFMTAGATEREAVKLMRAAWARHKAQTGAFGTWAEMFESVAVAAVEVGVTLRDGEAF